MFPIQDENRATIRPYVSYGLLLINIVVFFLFFLQGTEVLWNGIKRFGAIPQDIIRGERLWTLLTSMFMHANVEHLLGNMVYLWIFGDNVEDALGHAKYLAFFLLGGVAASLVHIASLFAILPSLGFGGLDLPSVGASGAISAVLGAYLLLYPRARIRTLVFYPPFIRVVSVPAYYYFGFWFLYQLMMGVFSLTGHPSGVAFWAHIGGFAAGFFTLRLSGVKPRPPRRVVRRRPVRPLIVGPSFRPPLVDVMVEGGKVRVLAELPGVKEGDIGVEVSDWWVAISAVRGGMRFYRRIALPTRVIPRVEDSIFRNGVLSFTLYRKT